MPAPFAKSVLLDSIRTPWMHQSVAAVLLERIRPLKAHLPALLVIREPTLVMELPAASTALTEQLRPITIRALARLARRTPCQSTERSVSAPLFTLKFSKATKEFAQAARPAQTAHKLEPPWRTYFLLRATGQRFMQITGLSSNA